MKHEKNKDTLRKSLQNLPSFEPESSLWDRIEEGVQRGEQAQRLQNALKALPVYEPPANTWSTIEKNLNEGKRIALWPRIAAIAAAVSGITLALWILFQQNDRSAIVTVAYHEEVASPLPVLDLEEDAEAIDLIREKFTGQPAFLVDEQDDQLLAELEELELARAELNDAIQRLGADQHLLKEMVKIEQQRTDVLEEMAAQI